MPGTILSQKNNSVFCAVRRDILWIVIVFLSMIVYGNHLDNTRMREGLSDWTERKAIVLEHFFYAVGEPEFKGSNESDIRKYVDFYLNDVIALPYDDYFKRLSENEKKDFYELCYKLGIMANRQFNSY